MTEKLPYSIEDGSGPCDLVPKRVREREVIQHKEVHRQGGTAAISSLMKAGFYKLSDVFFREACGSCDICKPIRLRADTFKFGKTQRRILNTNADLTARVVGGYDIDEHYRLYARHQRERFPVTMGYNRAHVQSIIDGRHFKPLILEYRLGGELVGAMIFNKTDDGVVANTSYYDPALSDKRSLGTFMVLDMVRRMKEDGKPHVYLGPWSNESHTVYAYKGEFGAAEVRQRSGEWTPAEP